MVRVQLKFTDPAVLFVFATTSLKFANDSEPLSTGDTSGVRVENSPNETAHEISPYILVATKETTTINALFHTAEIDHRDLRATQLLMRCVHLASIIHAANSPQAPLVAESRSSAIRPAMNFMMSGHVAFAAKCRISFTPARA